MRFIPATHGLRLSSKLFLANLLTSGAFLLIAAFITFSFLNVSSKTSGVARKDIVDVIHNSRVARELSRVFSDIDLLDRSFYRNTDFLDSEGKRLTELIETLRGETNDQRLAESLASLSARLGQFLSHSAVVNEIINARESVDQEIHTQLTGLEELISEWLIESTLKGKNTDYVVQQLTLVNGYRESLLNISKLYAELDFNTSNNSLPRGNSTIIEAIDDLTVRLQTITASIPEVARYGENLKASAREYRVIVERLFEAIEHLQFLRVNLRASRSSSLLAMEAIDNEIATSAETTVSRIEEIVGWSGKIVVVLTLGIIAFTFFSTRHLIKSNIQTPIRQIVDTIDSFSRGKLNNRIELGRKDEWDTIGRSLNSMAADLDQSRKALQASYDELERKVEERTKKLGDTVKALSISESSLVEAQRIAHLGHWSWDIQTGSNIWSEEQYRIFGVEPFEFDVNYELFASFLHPDDSRRVLDAVSEAVKKHKSFKEQHRIVRRDGSIRWIEAQGQVRRNHDDEPIEMSGTVLDITERKRIEHLLLEEKERALVTLHSIGDAVISTDAAGSVEYLNPVAEKMTGYSVDEARKQPLEQIFHIINEETRERAENPAIRCLEEGKIVGLANHTVLVSKSGVEYAIQDSAAPIRSQEGEILGVVLVFSDITEARHMSRQISYQANHDDLTGLINRREFEHRLKRVKETARSESTDNALCYLDLDQFKLVNDTCGHVAGDELLRQVAKLLQDNIRHRDTLARLGGDEFGLLMEHCSLKEAMRVATKLVEVVSDYKFLWEKQLFKVGVSIGLITVNESSADINALLSYADTACYMAKDQGRNRIHLYQENDEELSKRHGEMQWAVRLPRALEEDCFKLYVQAIVPVASKKPKRSHYEVLLRMKEDNIVLPEAFLPAADRYNLSSKLDRWVITNAFQWIVEHPEHLKRLDLCAINLSGHSLNDETFLDFIRRKFGEFPIPPGKICFEITETVAITHLSRSVEFIDVLKAHGCRFALDDFGSGLSSFAYLKNLPVDFLKIDGVFVKDILDDPLDLAMVKSINEIGHIMGKQTIAEFVENKAILKKLREIGVDYVQGYAIGCPKPIEDALIS